MWEWTGEWNVNIFILISPCLMPFNTRHFTMFHKMLVFQFRYLITKSLFFMHTQPVKHIERHCTRDDSVCGIKKKETQRERKKTTFFIVFWWNYVNKDQANANGKNVSPNLHLLYFYITYYFACSPPKVQTNIYIHTNTGCTTAMRRKTKTYTKTMY